jgi:hypothetical protein
VTTPVIRAWFAVFAGFSLLAAVVLGSRWFGRGDPFEVYSALVGRLSWLGRRRDGCLVGAGRWRTWHRRCPRPRGCACSHHGGALVAQLPLLAVMVGYTVTGLLLLFAA